MLLALVAMAGLASGCGTAKETASLESAVNEAVPVLERTEPETARRWRAWLERHSIGRLLEAVPPDIEITPFPGHFDATAYAAPVLDATRTPDRTHRHPILGAPSESIAAVDLPTRREYAEFPERRPPVLGWVSNGLDAYLAEVNGSVALRFADGGSACLDWVRTNERPYTSLGRRLVEEGHADADTMTLQTIRRLHDHDSELVEALMLDNDRVVYFREMPCDDWPEAASGARLIAGRAAAVDPETIPLGSIIMLERTDGRRTVLTAVDIGGAIKQRRIDLFIGAGEAALEEAGGIVELVRVWILRPRDPTG
ncbi:MAG: hypothetical protein GY895_16300 [Phycisphaera sp.]|nr:hypothetical protein [Phycisphaera sp.]